MDKVQTIIKETAKYFMVSQGLIIQKANRNGRRAKGMRTTELVTVRQIVMFMIKENTDLTLKQIGKKIGGRDHSTVLYAIKRVEALRDTEKAYREHLEKVRIEIDLKFNPTKKIENRYKEFGYAFI